MQQSLLFCGPGGWRRRKAQRGEHLSTPRRSCSQHKYSGMKNLQYTVSCTYVVLCSRVSRRRGPEQIRSVRNRTRTAGPKRWMHALCLETCALLLGRGDVEGQRGRAHSAGSFAADDHQGCVGLQAPMSWVPSPREGQGVPPEIPPTQAEVERLPQGIADRT